MSYTFVIPKQLWSLALSQKKKINKIFYRPPKVYHWLVRCKRRNSIVLVLRSIMANFNFRRKKLPRIGLVWVPEKLIKYSKFNTGSNSCLYIPAIESLWTPNIYKILSTNLFSTRSNFLYCQRKIWIIIYIFQKNCRDNYLDIIIIIIIQLIHNGRCRFIWSII